MIEPAAIAHGFPSLANKTYLNTAAEGIPPLAVNRAMNQYLQDKLLGMDGREAHFATVQACREIVSRFLAVRAEEVAFCSCSSEAYNLLSTALTFSSADEVVVSDLDFPAGTTPWLATKSRPHIRLWASAGKEPRLEDLSPLLNDKTRLVQVSLVSFYNGYLLPWAPFRDLVRKRAPGALLAVDVTQALGRCVLDCNDADIIISSTHKWALGIHGGGIVAIPSHAAERLTAQAGGWYNQSDAFGSHRFEKIQLKIGAPSFSVGMPNFVSIYSLHAALLYLETIGVDRIAAYADPLVQKVYHGLLDLGLTPLAAPASKNGSGIVAFSHPEAERLHRHLHVAGIHIMHHAGRLRIAIHGYNTAENVGHLLEVLGQALKKVQ
jgi:cysteine desulfurase / selenocysteine lyase